MATVSSPTRGSEVRYNTAFSKTMNLIEMKLVCGREIHGTVFRSMMRNEYFLFGNFHIKYDFWVEGNTRLYMLYIHQIQCMYIYMSVYVKESMCMHYSNEVHVCE